VQNLLLVNLMRMGDILQMTPLIKGFRETHPGSRVSVVVNEAFVEVASRVDADSVHSFPMRSFIELVSRMDGLVEAYRCLEEQMKAVNAGGPYDLVFNLTPSQSASSFCSLIAHETHRGTGLGEDGSLQAPDPWTAYLVAMMANRRTNPFHLVDIWLQAIGQRGPRRLQMALTPEDLRRADALLAACGVELGSDLLVGFQVSASQKEKCWSEKEFVRLGQALHQGLNARVLFFGQAGEEPLNQRISSHVPRSVNLAGRTGLGELAGALKRCQVLVTNDTGTQHVAAAVGTRVVVVSVGPVFFRETGPYGESHLVFQARIPCAPCSFHVSCLKPVCKERIRAMHVYKALVRLLRGDSGVPSDLPAEVSCYRSGFDGEGYLEFSTPTPTPEDLKLRAYKGFWQGLLRGCANPSILEEERVFDPDAFAGWSRLQDLLVRSSALMGQILETEPLSETGSLRLRVLSANLKTAEQEMGRLALETEDLSPVLRYLLLRREASSSRNPLHFLEEASSLYALTAEQIVQSFGSFRARKEATSHG
jgi:ADP-heptose:LPS heptosyltransferase